MNKIQQTHPKLATHSESVDSSLQSSAFIFDMVSSARFSVSLCVNVRKHYGCHTCAAGR